LARCEAAFLPDVEDAVADLLNRHILQGDQGRLVWGDEAHALADHIRQLTWPVQSDGVTAVAAMAAGSERVGR
nr:hypothetical protein [Candidatus Sericytochromatia bacterium]